MLEGLEITEIQLKDLENNFTIGSEFYSKFYVDIVSNIQQCKYPKKRLDQISSQITDGDHSAPDYREEGILYLLSESIKSGYIDDNIYRYITLELHKKLRKSALHSGDVLVTKTGVYFGQSAVVPQNFPEANTSAHVGIIRLSDDTINPYFLSTFINSKYGYHQFRRRGIKATRPEIKLVEFNDIKVVEIPSEVQIIVEKKVKEALEYQKQSNTLYACAEMYLLEKLKFNTLVFDTNACNIKMLKESFLQTGRFDSEYYLPQYEDYYQLVQAYSDGYDLLGNGLCTIKDANYTPENSVQYKYIELADIGKSGEIISCDIQNGEDLPTRARRIVHSGDVIVSSIEGSLNSCALITDEYNGALCSTGFYVLQSKKYNPETLLTLFKSEVIQKLMKKGCSGTILTAISKTELEKLPLPLIREEVQNEIAQHVQKSFALRKEAMHLLEKAKCTVEQAIEMGGGNLLICNTLRGNSLRELRIAEWILIEELNLIGKTKQCNKPVVTYKKLSNSFLTSNRLDAEYYQPKYDYLFDKLAQFITLPLGKIVTIQKSIEPGSDAYQNEGIPFVRVADLSKFGITEPSIYLEKESYNNVIRPAKDTILLSKDGSVGIAYKVEEKFDMITSGAILHLKVANKDVLSDYLTLVLNSIVVRMQAERDAGGSIIQHWKPSEIEKVVIPILPMEIQQELTEQIQQSFALRKESQQLLEQAKLLVEQTIEGTSYN